MATSEDVVDPHEAQVLNDELACVGNIMAQLFSLPETDTAGMLQKLGRSFIFPSNYMTFDLETTGFSFEDDWITEVGWAVVRNRRITDSNSLILDWTRRPEVNQQILRDKLDRLIQVFAEQGRVYRISYDRMRNEGVDPVEGLTVYLNLLGSAIRDGEFLIGHGARRFDRKFLATHADEYLGTTIPWDENLIFDTGLIEVSAQLGLPPFAGEPIGEWLERMQRASSRCKWGLAFCSQKYNLPERFGAEMSQAHNASYDCQLTYALFETFTQLAEIMHGPAAGG